MLANGLAGRDESPAGQAPTGSGAPGFRGSEPCSRKVWRAAAGRSQGSLMVVVNGSAPCDLVLGRVSGISAIDQDVGINEVAVGYTGIHGRGKARQCPAGRAWAVPGTAQPQYRAALPYRAFAATILPAFWKRWCSAWPPECGPSGLFLRLQGDGEILHGAILVLHENSINMRKGKAGER